MRTPWQPRDHGLGNADPDLLAVVENTYRWYADQHWEVHLVMLDLINTAIGQALFGVKSAIQEGHCE